MQPGTLTARQAEVLEALILYTASHGVPPTIRELAELLGITYYTAVAGHLNALRKKGYVDWIDGKSRTLRVLDPVA